jgi:signal transduction histidine kinase
MILNQEPVKISEVIKESLKLFRSSIPATIEIRQDIGCESDMVMAEPTQINKVLTNLCTNAYHAMYDKGGILEVRLEKKNFNPGDRLPCPDMNPGSYLLLTVGDTGCGMDHNTIERIFDPYFTTKQVGKGSGMGLAVVHGIVTNHQGFIAVESEPGKGSVFKIYLPVNYA